jgi:hypothetical protein
MCLQSACNTSLHQFVGQDVGDSGSHEVMEVIGELDPQTGIYSIHQAAAGILLIQHECLSLGSLAHFDSVISSVST